MNMPWRWSFRWCSDQYNYLKRRMSGLQSIPHTRGVFGLVCVWLFLKWGFGGGW